VTRFPVPPWRGDQVRAYHHLRVLAHRHDLTCVALLHRAPPAAARTELEALGVRVEVVPLGLAGAAASLARVLVGDPRPFQALLGRGVPCLVVSESERRALGGGAGLRVVPNGVDPETFPYREDGRPPARLVFAGNLGYFPNVDAAGWLVREVLPRVRAAVPDA